MTRKIFCIITSVLVFFSFLFILSSAAKTGFDLDKETAVKLVKTYSEIRHNVGWTFHWYKGGASLEYIMSSEDTPSETILYKNIFGMYWHQVKDGYDPDSVKEMIKSTFTKSKAKSIIENSNDFFDKYYFCDGVWYYGSYMGATYTPYDNNDYIARPSDYFLDDEIENLVIKENANGFAVVSVPAHQLCDGGYATASRRDNITVDIFLTFEDGAWKVSGEDCFEMLFLTDRRVGRNGEFTEAVADVCLTAAIYDIYNYSINQNYAQCESGGLEMKIIQPEGITTTSYTRLEGNLADPETWKQFRESYCTKNVADLLAPIFYLGDDGLYYFTGVPHSPYGPGYQLTAEEDKNKNTITIVSKSDSAAEVAYHIKNLGVTLNVGFVKTVEGWKVSTNDWISELDTTFGLLQNREISHPNPGTSDMNSVFTVMVAAAIALVVILPRKKNTVR